MRYLALSIFLFCGCGTTCPQVKDTRCLGSVVEICGSNNKWQRVLDCSHIKPISSMAAPAGEWICSKSSTGYTCVTRGQ